MSLIRRFSSFRALTLLFVLVLCGCSARKIAYSWADRFILNRLDSTFDLNAEQKKWVLGRLGEHLGWHRREELPRYAATLDRLREQIKGDLTRDQLEHLVTEVEAAAERLSARMTPDAGMFLSMLSPEQISNSEKEFDKRTKERFAPLSLPERDYVKAELKDARKALKTWTGESTQAQLDLLGRFIQQSRTDQVRRRDNLLRNQQAFLTTLRSRPSAEALSDLLRRWMAKEQIEITFDFQRAEQRSRAEFISLLLSLHQSLTAEQRQHLSGELGQLSKEMKELAAGT